MGSTHPVTLPTGPELPPPAPPSRSHLRRYLLLLLLMPLLFYPLPFFIATSASYEHWSTSQWGPMLEYAYDPTPKNADVVIFGDSSAFIGLDPRILNATLGIHSIVLPDTIGSIPVTRDAPLATYFAHNRPPKLLILYFSAWNLDFDHIQQVRRFEGEEMMLRHESWPVILNFGLHHPLEILQFPFRLYSTFGPKMISAALHHVNREGTTAASLGHADFNDLNFSPLQSGCTLPRNYTGEHRTDSTQALLRRYSSPQTEVLVYLAPIPNCRNSGDVSPGGYPALHADPPRVLPPTFFAGDAYYAHTLPRGVPYVTAIFAEWLSRALPAQSKAP